MATTTELPQHMQALKRGNDVRLERAKIRAGIKSGNLSIKDVLTDPPACINTMMIYDLLECQMNWGEQKIFTLLNKHYILSTKQIQEMTQRQRELVASKLK